MSKYNAHKQRIRSVAEFVRVVGQITDKWNKKENKIFFPWFRGHSETDWSLLPGKYRDPYIKIDEDEYRHDFKLKSFPYLIGGVREPTNEWEWYFIMQHYGLPTRLLDWTESSLVALYFALRDAKPKKHAAVWILDPWKLNKKVGRKGDWIMFAGNRQIQSYLSPPYSKRKVPLPPIALQPPQHSR